MCLHNLNLVLSRQISWSKIFKNLGSLIQGSCHRILWDTERIQIQYEAGGTLEGRRILADILYDFTVSLSFNAAMPGK